MSAAMAFRVCAVAALLTFIPVATGAGAANGAEGLALRRASADREGHRLAAAPPPPLSEAPLPGSLGPGAGGAAAAEALVDLGVGTRGPRTSTSSYLPPEKRWFPIKVLLGIILIGALGMGAIGYVLRDYGGPVAVGDLDAEASAETGDADVKKGVPEGPIRGGHRVSWQQYAALTFWFLLLLTQSAFTRLVCQLGIPRDCKAHMDPLKIVEDVHLLIAYGFAVAVLTELPQPDRFGYVFNFRDRPYRGIWFLVVFFLSSPVFGSLDLLPFLTHFSLRTGSVGSIANNILLGLLVGGFLVLLAWHFWWAFKRNPLPGFYAYAGSRFVIWGLYVAYFVAASRDLAATFHMHHYIAGFLFAIIAEFNHPVSLALLSIGSGIMVQGIAAYDADPLIYREMV